MKITYYEISLGKLTIDGYSDGVEILGNFFKKEDAQKFAKEWEKKHQKFDPYHLMYSSHYDANSHHVSFYFNISERKLEIN